jgi:predicted dehydrogenase
MGSTHAQVWTGTPGAQLAAVMSSSEKRLAGDFSDVGGNLDIAGQKMDFSAVRKYRTVEEILGDPELDAVDICLPTYLHAPVAIQALRAGKHVLVEKPMALDAASAAEMIEEAERQQRILMVGQALRFVPQYRALAGLVESGRLGRIRSALFRRRTAVPTWGPWEFDPQKSGGGVFDLLIHDVDFALRLFGAPEAISASGHEAMAAGIDLIVSEFHYPDIGPVTITGGWHHAGEYPFSMEYTVIGDSGVAEFDSIGRPAAVFWAGGKSEELPAGGPGPFQAEIEYFVECCRERRPPEFCPPRESALAVAVARVMVEARKRRGEKVPLAVGASVTF